MFLDGSVMRRRSGRSRWLEPTNLSAVCDPRLTACRELSYRLLHELPGRLRRLIGDAILAACPGAAARMDMNNKPFGKAIDDNGDP